MHVEEAFAPECIVQQVVSSKNFTGLFVCGPAAKACSFPGDIMVPIALKQRMYSVCIGLYTTNTIQTNTDHIEKNNWIVLVCIQCNGMYCMYGFVLGVYCLIGYVLECIACIRTSCIFGRVSSSFTLIVSKYTPILSNTCQSVLYIPLLIDTHQSIHNVLTQDYACIALY